MLAGAPPISELGGFPPGRRFLLLPRSPRRATAASLALYEAVEPVQRLLLAAMRVGSSMGVGRLLRPVGKVPDGLDVSWWEAWFEAIGTREVPVATAVAYRVPPNGRTSALLLDASGRPAAFVKILSHAPSDLDAAITTALEGATSLPFSVPRVLDVGAFQGTCYRLYTPLPEGAHRRPPGRPARVRIVLDGWRSSLAHLPRPDHVAAGDVICHSDFTPRNLRVTHDRRWWLIDWDNARWGPRLADELHYWCADRSWRARHDLTRDSSWILKRLRERGTDEEIAAACAWREAPVRTYRAAEQNLRAAVGALASGGSDDAN